MPPKRKADSNKRDAPADADRAERPPVDNSSIGDERRYQALFEFSPIGIHEIDLQGRLMSMNPSGLRMMGFESASEIRGLPFLDIVCDEDQDQVAGLLQDATQGRASHFRFTARGPRCERIFSSAFVPIQSNAEQVMRLMGISDDSTDRVHAEVALRESEQRYRAVVEDQTDFIVRWQPGGIRTFVNEAYCRYFGQSREEVIGTSFFPLISEADREMVEARLSLLTREHPVSPATHRVVLPDGSQGWQEWTDRILYNDAGELIGYQSIGRDVTQRKLAEAEEKEAAVAATQIAMLSPREREVFRHVVNGRPNKSIARQLDINIKTVEKHRANLMKKLGVRTIADLVRLATLAEKADG